MKNFLKVFPFLLVFVLVFALQVRLDVGARHLPYLEPFGRETMIGPSTANRPPQVLPDNRIAYLAKPDIVIAGIDPAGQQVSTERRPAPADDLFASTQFRLSGDEIYWIGNKRVLKRATWQNGAWSTAEELGPSASGLGLAESGEQRYLLAGFEGELKIWKIEPGRVIPVRNYPMKKPVYLDASVDGQGVFHIGAVNQLSSDSYEFYNLTLDTATGTPSDATMIKALNLDSSSMIDDMNYGIDRTHGYLLMTIKTGRSNNRDVRVWNFPLQEPTAGKMFSLAGEVGMSGGFTIYGEPGQQETLGVVFAADYQKNPRVGNREIFMGHFKGGEWQGDAVRISNTQKPTANPVFVRQGDVTTVVFTVFTSFDEYTLHYNSDSPSYAAATNVLTGDDYAFSAMQVPQYLGMMAVLFVLVMAWPVLAYVYLIWYLIKNEDALYDQPNRHFVIAFVLYLLVQVAVFLNYGKFDQIALYGPEWMLSPVWFSLLIIGMGVLSWGFAYLFGRIRYERHALAEFNYFFGLNTWMVTLALSYFMAA
ncbi:hypothetical protein OS242_00270 [Tumebacillus sp. DT12]|uniref:Yip1 domain-containing protein n=1 Tax=Tumebacillus lacus TaxID=2995335 RepID=A0ABT3WW12_9BACL|nr:hypothetical protein [Tumebacillus lacus]MCX7568406.1 hypothetical protein [Tumebacillus lacus]